MDCGIIRIILLNITCRLKIILYNWEVDKLKLKVEKHIRNIDKRIIKIYQMATYSIITLMVIIGAASIQLGAEVNKDFYLGIILLIPLGLITYMVNKRHKILKNIAYLKDQWKKEKKQYKERDFDKISMLFKKQNDLNNNDIIDNQTWSDLNMSKIFEKLDRTLSTPGEMFLYDMLRKPLFNKHVLTERSKTMQAFTKDEMLRVKTQLALMKLGREEYESIAEFLWDDIPKPSKLKNLFSFLSILAVLSLSTFLFMGVNGILIAIPVYIINFFVHIKMRKKYAQKVPIIAYLSSLIRTALEIQDNDVNGIEIYQQRLRDNTKYTKAILKKTTLIRTNFPMYMDIVDTMREYVKIIFLIEVRAFNSSLSNISKNIGAWKDIYLTIGELDAMQSIASYREEVRDFVEPNFADDNMLNLTNARHPLLDNPVSNSINISNKGILITGSNMAGKSTFLRTIGINALLAQTISTCLASSYKGDFFHIITSISQADDISEGKSFYFAESERLFKMIRLSERKHCSLCIVDELLAGTNSLERLSASEEILKYMISKNAITIVATHDLELAKRLDGHYKCYYFNDNVSNKGLDFDYTIKSGIAVTSNAIKLLDYLGYPQEIVENAKEEVARNIALFKH